jgi:ribose transport system substrate-binding protein
VTTSCAESARRRKGKLVKRIIRALGCALLLGGSALAQEPLDIVVIVKATTSPFWQTVFAGAEDAAEELGVNLTTLGAAEESDIAGQIAILENAVTQGPDAIVIAPTAFEPLGAPIERAAERVPIIKIDSAADTDAYTSFLATDNFAAGQLAADALAEAIEALHGAPEGEIAILTALPGVGSLTERDNGFRDGLANYPGLREVANRFNNNDANQALSNTLDLLVAHPNLVGIFADNLPMGVGSGRAIAERGLEEQVAVVAFDADEQEIAFLQGGQIKALVVQNPYRMGYEGVKTAVAAARGEEVEREIDTGVTIVTMENFDTPEVQALLYPETRQ